MKNFLFLGITEAVQYLDPHVSPWSPDSFLLGFVNDLEELYREMREVFVLQCSETHGATTECAWFWKKERINVIIVSIIGYNSFKFASYYDSHLLRCLAIYLFFWNRA